MIIKRDSEGRITRVSGHRSRVELGAQNYGINAVQESRAGSRAERDARSPGSNALEVADAVQATMQSMLPDFPAGIAYEIIYNPSGIHPGVGRGGSAHADRRDHPRCASSSFCSCRAGARR